MLKKIFEKGKRILIAGVLCMGALLAASKDAAPVKAAEPDGPVIRLEDAEVYGAVIHQSVVTVPIVVEGTVDMHLYDLKVTYDPAVLQPLQEEILVGNWNGIGETAADSGQLHLAGVSLEESARTASGTVGRLSFAPNRVITTDGFATWRGHAGSFCEDAGSPGGFKCQRWPLRLWRRKQRQTTDSR